MIFLLTVDPSFLAFVGMVIFDWISDIVNFILQARDMQCIIYGVLLAKEAVKPSKLKYHLHAELNMCIHQVYVQFAHDGDIKEELA